jgi:aromatic amino acid transport protein
MTYKQSMGSSGTILDSSISWGINMNKIVGSTLIGAGTAIGAAMLAFPLVTAGPGFLPSSLIFIGIWALMFVSSLLTLEVNLAFKAPQNSYPTMASATLGQFGRLVTYLSFLSLLYMLIAAYITGGGSLFEAVCIIVFKKAPPEWVNELIFTAVLGVIVTLGTRAVDLFNRSLFTVMLILIGLVFTFFLPQVDVTRLFTHIEPQYTWAALPVILTAFGFHIVIPSIAPYLNYNVGSLKQVLFFSSLLPLIIYILWIMALLGTLPYEGEMGFRALAQGDGSLSSLMLAVNHWRPTPWLNGVINIFANFAMITSFLGVSLGLFDCLHDKKEKVPHRARTALLTFVPPLLVVIFYPEGFVTLLSVASIFVSIILIILPALMAYRRRQLPNLPSPYVVFGGNVTLVVTILLGFAFIAVELLRQYGKLPIWS